MGSIRTLLAIAVVFAHSYGFVFVGGMLAVQLFYIISGFLISYILVEAQTYQSTKAFYKNRFLRLFPIYWFVSLATLLAVFCAYFVFNETHEIIFTFETLDWFGRLSLALSNVSLFGQDWLMFTGVRDGSFQFVSNFRESEVVVWTGLIVPQSWTLGVELSFYVIAPFIITKPRLMLVLLFFSLLLRAYLISIGLGTKDPWSYRFFPTELALFLLGACSHQFLKPLYESKGLIRKKPSIIVTLSVFVYCFVYFLLPYRDINTLLLLMLFLISLPYIFFFQSSQRWDRKIGELSYPIYISHMLVIWTVGHILSKLGVDYKSLLGSWAIVISTVILSYLINITVGRYIESRRLKVKSEQLA